MPVLGGAPYGWGGSSLRVRFFLAMRCCIESIFSISYDFPLPSAASHPCENRLMSVPAGLATQAAASRLLQAALPSLVETLKSTRPKVGDKSCGPWGLQV